MICQRINARIVVGGMLLVFTAVSGYPGLPGSHPGFSPVASSAEPGSNSKAPETQRVAISGTGFDDAVEWEFYCTGGRNSGYWTTIPVPSCWEQEGFGAYNYGVNFYGKASDPQIPKEQGKYRYRFPVPMEWQGGKVQLVFEAVMTDARVRINGQEAGPVHRGGFYRFRYDITSLLKYGEQNLLEVWVSKESENASVNLAERRADYWNFGGIFRPVFLEVMPAQFIERAAIEASAEGTLRAELFFGEELPGGYRVSAQLEDLKGNRVGSPFSVAVPPASDSLLLVHTFRGIRPWTAETPHLYSVRFILYQGDHPRHTIRERIGFRSFEIREGEGFFLNGRRILLKGVNRHSFRPESGRTLNREANVEDVMLIREMNMNAVRMSHYPPDPEFLDACDELGLYVLDELGGWHGKYDTETGRKLVREMVTRDVNHPCILFWNNGNEGGWNTELDPEFSRWDPTKRPVLHPQQDHSGVETMHYRSYGETQEYLRGELIYFPTEMLHGLYDGGHGAGLYDYWEMMRLHPRCGGALLWDFADGGLLRTDLDDSLDTDGNHAADGILGPHLEKEGSFYTIKEIWSPVHIDKAPLPDDFNGRIRVENRYDFTNLEQCEFRWELGRFFAPADKHRGHRVLWSGKAGPPNIGPHETGILDLGLPGDWALADVLYLTVLDPSGQELWTWSWRTGRISPPEAERSGTPVQFSQAGDRVSVRSGSLELFFDPAGGLLKQVKKEGRLISFGGGPRFIAARRGDRSLDGTLIREYPAGADRIYQEIQLESRLEEFEVSPEGDKVRIEARYFGPLSKVSWTVFPGGLVRLDYTYRYDGVVELMGIHFDYPETGMKSVRWLGEGPYRVWQNRLHGTVLDVWENQYNDAIPGQVFSYPEFKGYFSGWSWASFETGEGTIQVASGGGNSYLGIYTPRDGRDALLYTLPETGIAVLDVIPAVRNKVNATDLVGPSSRPCYVSGPHSATLYFEFE